MDARTQEDMIIFCDIVVLSCIRVSAGIRHEADGNEQPRELAGDDGVHAHQLPHHDAHQAQRSALRRDAGAVQHRQGDGVLPALPVHAGQVFGR
uniref:Uncharacterized protein n=1 Tax=Araneus ventricosus TaxID=182803 RepID=A0A4Y2FNP9_ARAVE|nr:hypothetical protein AVEN_49547-1 [Araneus ventricosus]